MSRSTFSGPVVSLGGFISGTESVAPSVTAATVSITEADYNGEIIPLNRAAGITATLPASTGSQAVYTFYVGTTFTGSGIVKVANSTDVMQGNAVISGGTAGTFGTVAASDTITMNGTTTGGLAGSLIKVRDIATGFWSVEASLIGSGVAATPFSATV